MVWWRLNLKYMLMSDLRSLVFISLLVIECIFASAWCEKREFVGTVVKVADGDTIILQSDGQLQKIRLSKIDCPELSQPFGQQAKEFTERLSLGEEVKVVYSKRDRYDRILGEIILSDGVSLNKRLVEDGLAWHYKQFASDDIELDQLESQARTERRGLWSDDNPVSPWAFRKSKKASSYFNRTYLQKIPQTFILKSGDTFPPQTTDACFYHAAIKCLPQ